jgi:hypothetical protein
MKATVHAGKHLLDAFVTQKYKTKRYFITAAIQLCFRIQY